MATGGKKGGKEGLTLSTLRGSKSAGERQVEEDEDVEEAVDRTVSLPLSAAVLRPSVQGCLSCRYVLSFEEKD